MAEDDEESAFGGGESPELSYPQKKEIAKWFLLNSPFGEIQYVANEDVRSVLQCDRAYDDAADEAFPIYNKCQMISLGMPGGTGDVLITNFGEIRENEYLDPRTAQVVVVDHVNQICTEVRPAADEELPSPYVEEYRDSLDIEVLKYVNEFYQNGGCSVYGAQGKHVGGPGVDFELVVAISAARNSPQNFCNGSWRSVWNLEFKEDLQVINLNGNMQVSAHYFEEGNVQLDTKHECKDVTMIQSPEDSALSIAAIIRHHESEYLATLEASYSTLPDTTFKELRRKLPVTRTLFPWHNALQFNLTKDMEKELGIQR